MFHVVLVQHDIAGDNEEVLKLERVTIRENMFPRYVMSKKCTTVDVRSSSILTGRMRAFGTYEDIARS